jgi:hypothetical protein
METVAASKEPEANKQRGILALGSVIETKEASEEGLPQSQQSTQETPRERMQTVVLQSTAQALGEPGIFIKLTHLTMGGSVKGVFD